MRQGGITVAAIYCNRCGCENPSDRGACVRCLNLLQWPGGGNACGNCGADNAGHADYCVNCGSVLGDVEPAEDWSLAAAISLALGGEAGLGAEDEDEGYLGLEEDEPEAVPDLDFEESAGEEELALEEAPEPPMFEPSETAPADEEAFELPPPPPAVDEVEEQADDGDVDSEFAPVIPEDAAPEADADDLAALALELASEPEAAEAAEFAPPPPPPDALELDEVAEQETPEVSAAEEDGEEEDSVLGGWALELDDDK